MIEIVEAYARLKALRQNAPAGRVEEKFVSEFHAILDLLEKASEVNLKNFRIPASEVRRAVAAYSPSTGKVYSDASYCDRDYFLVKVDGVLMMFDLLQEGGESKIGFAPQRA